MLKTIAVAAGIAGVLVSLPVQAQGIQLQMPDNDLSQYCFGTGESFPSDHSFA
jgi:hypothetical protein